MTQGTASALQPGGGVPVYQASGASVTTKSPVYPTPPTSKPVPVAGPGIGIRHAAVTSNYTASLSDGFNAMHLQVCLLMLL